MKIKISRLVLLGFSILVFGGCAAPRSYNFWGFGGLYPIYPGMNYSYFGRYRTIDTLSPELKWHDVKKPNQTYDVAIWETPYRSIDDIKKKAAQPDTSWGILVYWTNNIPTNYYQLPIRLEPNTYYNWSVRIRDGEKVKRWSAFNQEIVYGEVQDFHNDTPFGFKTPPIPGNSIEVKKISRENLARYKSVAIDVASRDSDFNPEYVALLNNSVVSALRKSGRFDKVYESTSPAEHDADLKLSVLVQLVLMYNVKSIEGSVTLTDTADGKAFATEAVDAQSNWAWSGGKMTNAIAKLSDQIVYFATQR